VRYGLILRDPRPGLGGEEVVARPVGIERAWQTVRADDLGKRPERGSGQIERLVRSGARFAARAMVLERGAR
jgi:hypothetical protein